MLAIALLSACSSTLPRQAVDHSVPEGAWQGTLVSELVTADGARKEARNGIIIFHCDGQVGVMADHEGDGTYTSVGNYVVTSSPDTHLLYLINAAPAQPDWTEVQTYALLEIGHDRAMLQWSRAVNNRGMPEDHRERFFLSHGVADMKRVGRTCEPEPVSSE